MKLDSRIIEGKKPLTGFDIEEAKKFIGKKCYFGLDCESFENLNSKTPYILEKVFGEGDGYFLDSEDHIKWDFCLPCEWVSENSEEPEEPEESEEPEERDDLEDFLNIWFGCSSFGANGNLEVGKWSKLESLDLPFSKERVGYLIAKYLLEVPDSENPRVPF